MPIDAPDYVLWSQPVEVVINTPTPLSASTETPIDVTQGKVSDSTQTYQTLATWTVAAAKTGILYGVELGASDFTKANFQLTIGGVVKWTGIEWPTFVNSHYGEARLAAGAVVLLEGKSNSGTSVDMWGHIEGKEIG